MPKTGKATDERLDTLLDEIRQAVAWSRPSILLAVHRSKAAQSRAIVAMNTKLACLSLNVVHINPENEPINIIHSIVQKPGYGDSVFFILGLGNQLQIYSGLNLHREVIVEQRLKLVFWLTAKELVALSRRAPDFWAFRHRVIEFLPKPSSVKKK